MPRSVSVLQQRLQEVSWGCALLASMPSLGQIHISPVALLGSVSTVFSVILEILGALVFVFFVGLYLAASPRRYLKRGLPLLAAPHRARGREIAGALARALGWWLFGRAVTMTLMAC